LFVFVKMWTIRASTSDACAAAAAVGALQGAQWSKAAEVFEQMQGSGCKPDVVTYTALVSAYERGGQWVKALEVGCHLDVLKYVTRF
jgi:pentatricopeptide repeat protein